MSIRTLADHPAHAPIDRDEQGELAQVLAQSQADRRRRRSGARLPAARTR
jgi:hypothetical protein